MQLRHDCCNEVKEMLSGETGKTIFQCQQFSSFLSYSTYIIFARNGFAFFYGRSERPRAVACTGSGTALLIKLRHCLISITAKNKIQETTLRTWTEFGFKKWGGTNFV